MKALKRILVVDDDPVVATSFDRVLAPKGYAVITAGGGAEALDKLQREDYDVVYTDIKMPGMSGIEVAREIKASRPWMPVVIVTGYGTEANEAEAKALGVNAFLHKPLSPDAIEHSATAALAAAASPGTPAETTVSAPPTTGWRAAAHAAKNVGLFFAAPLVALFYVLVGPLVALGLLSWILVKGIVAPDKPQAPR